MLQIRVPRIAPTSWLTKYAPSFFFSTWPATNNPIVADGLTCPPEKNPAIEIAKKLKQLMRKVQNGL